MVAGIVASATLLIILLGVGFWLRQERIWISKGANVTKSRSDDKGEEIARKGVSEAMSSQISEIPDAFPVAATSAEAGRHEMPVVDPAAYELGSFDSQIHEMFDKSVYREMPSNSRED